MAWLYMHLPEEIGVVNFRKGDILKVINSEDCPMNKKRPCEKSGPCCLGTSMECQHNECHNKRLRKTPAEGF